MPDSQLQLYIPKLGDVYATKRFCQELFNRQHKYDRKTSLLEKLRRKLGSKYNKHDVRDEEESSDQRRAKLLGNANASKMRERLNLGGAISIYALANTNRLEIKMVVEQGKQRKQPVAFLDMSDKSLQEGNFSRLTTHVGKSVLGLDFPSASASVSPEAHVPTAITALCATSTPLSDSTPSSTMQSSDSSMQSSLLGVQVDNEIMFSLCAESYNLLSSEESLSVLCNSLPSTATSGVRTLCVDEMDDTVMFESESSESVNTLLPEVPASQINTFQATQEQEKLPSTLRIIHQGNCFTELIQLYQKEEMCLSCCTVKRVLPNGEDEKGEGVGLLRDIFTEFWESFYSKCCEGADIKVPILRHDMGEEEWKSVGRIICDGWSTLKYFPVQLAQPVLEDAVFGMITVSLTTTFLGFIPVSERTIIQAALDNFELVNMNDLLEVLESHECKKLPTPANIQSIIEEIAHKEILQEPRFVIESWRKVFGTNLEIDQNELCDIFIEKQPTVNKILNALNFPDVMDCGQQSTANYLKRFVKGLDKKGMENFLLFCTGSNLMSEKITVEFTRLYGFERRPVAHTCGSILQMPSTYETFSDM
ncbi:hypothetical protein ACJMK2_043738 [Sinanodonta woodiana]|uniref:Uncharacterized protein n=1 Tax=Sinanodonta woodiana TaxID=1069815 RepID=A0ABD3VXX0_SINWO